MVHKFKIIVATFFVGIPVHAMDVTFTNVADVLGVSYVGQTFGQSWGDFDNDGYVDLYVSNHGFETTFFKNNSGLGFTSINPQVTADLSGDIHAGAWADFDNDGDRDFLLLEGASGGLLPSPSRFLINDAGAFTDHAQSWGLENEFGRARMANWFDWNNDGLLDVAISNWPRSDGVAPSAVYTRSGSAFVYENDNAGYHPVFSNNFATLVKTNTQAEPVLLVNTVFGFPEGMFDMTQLPFVDLAQSLGVPTISAIYDFVAADFDGDLDQEIYLSRRIESNEVFRVNNNLIQANMSVLGTVENGFSFETSGLVTFNIGPSYDIPLSLITIGNAGFIASSMPFTLDSTDSNVWDTPIHSLDDAGLYIYFDTANNRWHVDSTPNVRSNMTVESTSPITNIQTNGFTSTDGARLPVLLKQTSSGYIDIAGSSGLNVARPCPSVSAADFDNDMDVDIFLTCASGSANRGDVLLENDGTGNFTEVVDAAGAIGTASGRGDTGTVADFDNDGFMDILVSNGAGNRPVGEGPTELFKNNGNGNHWIHLNLQGVEVNRDGVGAWVVLTAGGVSQSRLQNNGVKRYGQDDQRLHFGLGNNAVVDEIRIRWPGGKEQILTNVNADQVLTVVEDLDSDTDGILDAVDNCIIISNPLQTDADSDGFGNLCDTDLNNDLVTNFADLSIFATRFLSADPVADFNVDGTVNFLDLTIFSEYFLSAPGP